MIKDTGTNTIVLANQIDRAYKTQKSKLYGKQILNEPEKHFTEEILDKIDEFAKDKFTYGS